MKSTIVTIATTLSLLGLSILLVPNTPTPTTQYNLYVPNPYGDGIGAPHNVSSFTQDGQTIWEWTVNHGD